MIANKEKFWVSSLAVILILLAIGCDRTAKCFEVSVPDANLEQFMRIMLQEQEAPITNCMLETLDSFSTAEYVPIPEGSKIKDITGIEFMKNVRTLSLSFHHISDLSPLASLTKLENLHLSKNDIKDITPIERLTRLKKLFLSANVIEDISPVKRLTNLDWLFFIDNQIEDISVLSNLRNVTLLRLNENQISDITPLEKLTNLGELNLSHNMIENIDALLVIQEAGGMKEGFDLELTDNPLSDKAISEDIPFLGSQGVVVGWEVN
jgi:Leucine-rich repeat (LRR) protein